MLQRILLALGSQSCKIVCGSLPILLGNTGFQFADLGSNVALEFREACILISGRDGGFNILDLFFLALDPGVKLEASGCVQHFALNLNVRTDVLAAKSEEGQNGNHYYNQTDNVDDTVHQQICSFDCSKPSRLSSWRQRRD